jgi:hypothetical protein
MLTVLDEFTCECLAIEVATRPGFALITAISSGRIVPESWPDLWAQEPFRMNLGWAGRPLPSDEWTGSAKKSNPKADIIKGVSWLAGAVSQERRMSSTERRAADKDGGIASPRRRLRRARRPGPVSGEFRIRRGDDPEGSTRSTR